MANTEDKDEIRDQITQQLSQTPFACSSLTRLSGGTANFVYRGTPSSPDSIIIKHTKDYVASNQDFKLDAKRCHFEEAILQALDGLPSHSQGNITVKTPRVFNFDRERNTQILEDLPNSLDLKNFLLSGWCRDVSASSGRLLGRSLGCWLKSFHDWARKGEQAEIRSFLAQNESMKGLKFYVNYSMLMDTIANFPGVLEESRDVFEEVKTFAAAEMKERDHEDGFGIIHGDFWTGNVLIPNVPLVEQSDTTLFIIDWELCQIGTRALDLGQMIAELYETKLFKNVDCGVWAIQGFLEGYGPLSDDMAFRTAIHVGVHLVVWGSRVAGWGSEEKIEEVVKVGRDLIVQGWGKNKEWFERHDLECLFKQ
ncbi:hypothetical protein N7448_001409 [Penicillium atrosanguineum]|uniref:Aminoglycoside phosphotransferase domain-containing protein n=1 Tax=Penicillium atrosanguineum TaxID=1132637 RepID=A0A9W9HJK4_9EURO|nr:uncharacterized protein N7443_004806 [Penicillium atrosanguineum]KAJ5149831.1 hypothetical protein N7448_001409 [Penicillium atrosanguineum]KAJ5305146.1 hypothetical protein N7443_004806 [Penicillium atrosanguineum]KAJ5324611.1 hypothetical protein N7476_003211 [Penicillium atrosanguineum]